MSRRILSSHKLPESAYTPHMHACAPNILICGLSHCIFLTLLFASLCGPQTAWIEYPYTHVYWRRLVGSGAPFDSAARCDYNIYFIKYIEKEPQRFRGVCEMRCCKGIRMRWLKGGAGASGGRSRTMFEKGFLICININVRLLHAFAYVCVSVRYTLTHKCVCAVCECMSALSESHLKIKTRSPGGRHAIPFGPLRL